MSEKLSVEYFAIQWRRAEQDVELLEQRLEAALERRANARRELEIAIDEHLDAALEEGA